MRFALLALIFFPISRAQTVAQMETRGWKLSFDDEFDGNRLDSKKWNRHYRRPRIYNHELQAYIADAFSIEQGILRITAQHKEGKQNHQIQGYVSGAMTTFGKFSQEFGYFEIRCRIPAGQGFWSAFWLMPDKKWPPEIDVFENLGKEPSRMYFTNHWKDRGKTRSRESSYQGEDFSRSFHSIAVEWTADALVWYIDGVERARSTEGTPRGRFYLLANLAVGGDWPGPPDRSTRFPAIYEIDYVRVYRRP